MAPLFWIVLFFAPCCPAGEVPPNAVTRSLGVDPMLLDTSSLLYQFPQRAVGPDSSGFAGGSPLDRSMIWATNLWSYASYENLGGLGRTRSVGFFALSQPTYLVGGESSVGSRSVFTNRNKILQAGVGARWGGLRTGVAYRATRDRSESGHASDRPGDTFDQLYGQQSEIDYHELAAGLGFDLGAAMVDGVLEWQDESYEEAYGNVSGSNINAIEVRGDASGASEFAARVAIPVGEALQLAAAGRYRWGERVWRGTRYSTSGGQPSIEPFEARERTKVWKTTVGLAVTTPILDHLVVSGIYERREEPLSGISQEDFIATNAIISTAMVTFSAEKELWRTLRLRAGFSAIATRTFERTVYGSDRTIEELDRRITDAFGWGLSYTWRRLQFDALFRTPPGVSSPLSVFDVSFEF